MMMSPEQLLRTAPATSGEEERRLERGEEKTGEGRCEEVTARGRRGALLHSFLHLPTHSSIDVSHEKDAQASKKMLSSSHSDVMFHSLFVARPSD